MDIKSEQGPNKPLDSAGKTVFSDRAPPPEVPDKAIRKRPSVASAANPATAASGQDAARPRAGWKGGQAVLAAPFNGKCVIVINISSDRHEALAYLP